jgi:hypothetical protein
MSPLSSHQRRPDEIPVSAEPAHEFAGTMPRLPDKMSHSPLKQRYPDDIPSSAEPSQLQSWRQFQRREFDVPLNSWGHSLDRIWPDAAKKSNDSVVDGQFPATYSHAIPSCESPTQSQGASMDEEIAEVVRQHGWFAANISDHHPPFLYSIGLMQTLKNPEFVMFGWEATNAYALFSQLVRDIQAGQSYAAPAAYTVNIEGNGHQFGFRRVHTTQHELYLGFAMGYCRHIGRWGELAAMQVFWPDSTGKFPFDVGCALDVFQLQPRLDIGLTPKDLRKWRRQWD